MATWHLTMLSYGRRVKLCTQSAKVERRVATPSTARWLLTSGGYFVSVRSDTFRFSGKKCKACDGIYEAWNRRATHS